MWLGCFLTISNKIRLLALFRQACQVDEPASFPIRERAYLAGTNSIKVSITIDVTHADLNDL